jgi:antitoxin component YwqK of YwqJK toxin-antitoxin module
MLAYKAAKNGETRVLITLEIPDDALTNMNRSSVVIKETAKYRANKANVLKIEDADGNLYETAESGFYEKKKILYKVGETVECPDYDMDAEKVCSKGIHFLLNREVAEQYELHYIPSGVRILYHENGVKQSECTFVNGLTTGLYQTWYPSGQQEVKCMVIKGVNHGLYQRWLPSGQIEKEILFENGKDKEITNKHASCCCIH